MTPRQNICYFLDPPVQSEETVLLMSDKIIKPTHCIIFLRLYILTKDWIGSNTKKYFVLFFKQASMNTIISSFHTYI